MKRVCSRVINGAKGQFGWWGWLVVAALGLLPAMGAWAEGLPVAPVEIRIGLPVAPAAPVPGAKVRTPVRMEVLLVQASPHGMDLHQVPAGQAANQVQQGVLDAWIGVLPDKTVVPSGLQRVTLDWSASPMAIMRSDTDIHTWPSLKGRTVCLAADGRYVGELAVRFGAIEQVYPSATDALLALRTGQCDATVQDESFLRQLLKFPEWRKFSAQLSPYRHGELVGLVRTDLPVPQRAALSQAMGLVKLQSLAKKQAREIAFEVYLDQAVPDCH